MIEYIEEPHFAHHIEPAIEHVKLTAAQYYTSILSQFTNHKNNTDVHVTKEDREKWDNKADKVSLYDLEQRIVDKANKKDIPTLVSELKNDVPYLTASSIDAKLDNKGYVTWEEIKNNVSKNLNLDDYLTKTQADNTYAKKSDMTGYITSSTISNYLGDYIKKNSTLFYYNGSPVSFGGSISAPTGGGEGGGESVDPIIIPYTLPQATSSVLGGIKIGYQPIAGTKIYAVELDNEGKAFVRVPWVAAESSDDHGGSSEIPEDIQNQLDSLTLQINNLIDFINGQQLTDKVTTIVDQKTGSWTTIVTDLQNCKSAIQLLKDQITMLSTYEDLDLHGYLSALSTRVSQIGATASMVASGLQYDETTGTWTINPDVMAAVIAGVEGDTSFIQLIADQVQVIAEQLSVAGELVIGSDSNTQIKAAVYDIQGSHSTTPEPEYSVPQIRFKYNGVNSLCLGAIDDDPYHTSDDGWNYRNAIGINGAGKLANGNIEWDENGNIKIKNVRVYGNVAEYLSQPNEGVTLAYDSPDNIIVEYVGAGRGGVVPKISLPSASAANGKTFEIITMQVGGAAEEIGFASDVFISSNETTAYSGAIKGHVKLYSNGTKWILLFNDTRFPA